MEEGLAPKTQQQIIDDMWGSSSVPITQPQSSVPEPQAIDKANSTQQYIDSLWGEAPVESGTDRSSLWDIIKHSAKTSLTGRGIRGVASLLEEGPTEPTEELNLTPWDENWGRALLERGVGLATDIAIDAPLFAALTAAGTAALPAAAVGGATLGTAKGASYLAKLLKAGKVPFKEGVKLATGKVPVQEISKHILAKPVMEQVVKQAVPAIGREAVRYGAIPGALYGLLKSPLEQVQETGEYSPGKHALETAMYGASVAALTGAIIGAGRLLKNIKPIKPVDPSNQVTIKDFVSENNKLLDDVLTKNRIEFTDKAFSAAKSGQDEVVLLNWWDRLFGEGYKVIERAAEKMGIPNATKTLRGLLYANRQAAAKKNEYGSRIYSNLKSILKSEKNITRESVADYLLNIDFNGNIINKGLIKNLNNPKATVQKLQEIRNVLNELWVNTAQKDWVGLKNYILSHVNNPANQIDDNVVKLVNARVNSVEQEIISQLSGSTRPGWVGGSDTLNKIIESRKYLYSRLLGNEEGQVSKQMAQSLPRKMIMNPEIRERPFIQNYMKRMRKAEFVPEVTKGAPISDEYVFERALRTPSSQMVRASMEGIPENQLEKDIYKLLTKYVNETVNYNTLNEPIREVRNLYRLMKNQKIMNAAQIEAVKQKFGIAAQSVVDRYIATPGKKGKRTLDTFLNAVSEEMAKRGDFSRTEMRVLNKLFKKKIDGKENPVALLLKEYLKDARVRSDFNESVITSNISKYLSGISEDVSATALGKIPLSTTLSNKDKSLLRQGLRKLGVTNRATQEEMYSILEDVKDSPLQKIIQNATQKAAEKRSVQVVNETELALKTIIKEAEKVGGLSEPIKKINYKLMQSSKAKTPEAKLQRLKEAFKSVEKIQRNTDVKRSRLDRAIEGIEVTPEGKLSGAYGEAIEEAFDQFNPLIKTDATDYFKKWVADFLSIPTDASGFKGKSRLVDTLNKLMPQDSAIAGKVKSKLRDYLGKQINPEATWENLTDTIVSQIYVNLMGWKPFPVVRNLMQSFTVAAPGIEVPFRMYPELWAKSFAKLFDKNHRARLAQVALKKGLLISETGQPGVTPFAGALEKAFNIKRGLDKVGMWMWNTSDIFNRYLTYTYAELAAQKVLASKNSTKLLNKMLAKPFVSTSEKKFLLDILKDGTPEAQNKFISEFAKLMSDNHQFIYEKFATGGLQRSGRLGQLFMMFSKWPVKMGERYATNIAGLTKKETAGASAKYLAKDIMYAGTLVAFARALGMDIRAWHPATTVSGRISPPALSFMVDPSGQRALEYLTPVTAMTKGTKQALPFLFRGDRYARGRTPILGIPSYKKGQKDYSLEQSALGKILNLFEKDKK